MTLGNTPVSFRKSDNGRFITIADDIEALVARQPGLTETEIAKTLFANEGDSQRVSLMCRRLIAEGRLRRSGAGTMANPFHVFAKRRITRLSGLWRARHATTTGALRRRA
jgi:hypothetical protein